MDIDIEILRADDTDTIDQLIEITETFASESLIYSELGFNGEKFRTYIKSFTQDGTACVVAKIEGKVVGYAPLYIDMNYIDKMNFEIVSIYVPPPYRNSGVGTRIVETLVALLEENKASYSHVAICAYFKQDRELIQKATERLFKRHGFEQIGVILGKKGV